MDTLGLRRMIQHPSKVDRLLESHTAGADILPKNVCQIRGVNRELLRLTKVASGAAAPTDRSLAYVEFGRDFIGGCSVIGPQADTDRRCRSTPARFFSAARYPRG